MNLKQTFSNHYSRFKRESIIKSLLFGSIFGFLAAVIASALFWYFDVKAFWLSVPVFIVVTLGAGYLLSVTKFKPQAEYMARKLDAFGLEQRLITMTELENDTSYIASLQRKDALKSTEKVNGKLIKFAVSVPLVIGVALTFLLSGGMTTVNALSSAGVIRSGKQIVADANMVPDVYCNVNYVVSGSGLIMGDDAQIVLKGESCTAVYAVPDYGYAFIRWSDGHTEPYRQDFEISKDVVLTAIFEPLVNVNEKESVKDGTSNMPNDPEETDDFPRLPEWTEPTETPDNPPDDKRANTASDSRQDTVFDGETDYGGKNYSDAVSDASNGASGSGGAGEVVGDYFANIKK